VPDRTPSDSLATAARLLTHLANTYGVSGHEGRVRDAVRAELPAWARAAAVVDSAGNLVVAVGPDRDTVAFVAHLDEIGYEVTAIRGDGQVALRPLGGFYASLWEGQPALLHFDARRPPTGLATAAQGPGPGYYAFGDLPGVFVPRAAATTRQPAELAAWFGLDSAALVRAGVHVGQSVTGVKDATRLGPVRFTGRASDDRTGCTALLLAMRALDPARLTHKVVFAFTTREETGLFGAAALAAEVGRTVRRVYAVDTFVSSDAPLESHRFADAPLGGGAVVRAVDNSSAAPPAAVDEVAAVARRAGIPVQVGTTNGGNDGAEFARAGAVDVPLSWPGRYSHSPVEVCDLRDLVALARLVASLAAAPASSSPASH
jgi:putative aminopeptidase FrvX